MRIWRCGDIKDISSLCSALEHCNFNDEFIARILINNIDYNRCSFEELNTISTYVLDDKQYIEEWFEKLNNQMIGDYDFIKKLSDECPELGLKELFIE